MILYVTCEKHGQVAGSECYLCVCEGARAEIALCRSAIRAKDDVHATLNFRLDNIHRILNRIAMSQDEDIKADALEALSYLKGERDEWRKGNPGTVK